MRLVSCIRGGRKMKKLTVLLVFIVVVALSGCNAEESELNALEKVLEDGYLIMGLDDTFAPMGFRDTDGEITGFDVELGQAVAEKLGVELRLQPIEWDSKVLELNAGNIDMIWNGLSITDERLLQMSFSDPYLNNRQIVLVQNDMTISEVSDLVGLKVGVQIDSSGQSVLQDNAVYATIGEMVQFNSFNDALLDLDSGRIDAIVIDEIMARYVVSQNTYSVVVTDVSLGDDVYGVGFRLEDTVLRDRIDAILDELYDEGIVSQISIKWFGEDVFLD